MTSQESFKNVYGYFEVFLEMIEIIRDLEPNDFESDVVVSHVRMIWILFRDAILN